MQKEYNNGQPERQGDEKNYQKYLDRIADMRPRSPASRPTSRAIASREIQEAAAAAAPQ